MLHRTYTLLLNRLRRRHTQLDAPFPLDRSRKQLSSTESGESRLLHRDSYEPKQENKEDMPKVFDAVYRRSIFVDIVDDLYMTSQAHNPDQQPSSRKYPRAERRELLSSAWSLFIQRMSQASNAHQSSYQDVQCNRDFREGLLEALITCSLTGHLEP